ncbi:Cell-cycle control medial ring component [Penicillium cf. griseofulvum]|uniref:Cell-cycle control medial ring component n=1 Tax=Penicillium cf. griseofulvum TaxID=2972120 RepID=A0A9W9IQ54_9EURO|nr:Cell-cycle control medial ring component [Penicillium cf. griseofulvum]KAJ5443085.1 Cell-cycle control medial ring component [Penicillium cf. griseofulvum]KAJ5451741.1 Cell-cycle control medial ring component [Penicillium cf. griseofulvum]
MSELTFTKSFLSMLDSRPIKLRADHVFDPEQIGLRVPYTLPRLSAPHPPMPKKVRSAQAPGSSKSITVRVKSARNPALEFLISNAALSTTSVQDIRDAVRVRVADSQGGQVPLDKIKILYKRKPVTGTVKTLAEVLADEPAILAGGKEVEIGVMIIGGAQVVESAVAQPEVTEKRDQSPPKAAIGPSGEEVLHTDAFWDDLQGYLEQRLKDEEEAKRLRLVFKEAWSSTK